MPQVTAFTVDQINNTATLNLYSSGALISTFTFSAADNTVSMTGVSPPVVTTVSTLVENFVAIDAWWAMAAKFLLYNGASSDYTCTLSNNSTAADYEMRMDGEAKIHVSVEKATKAATIHARPPVVASAQSFIRFVNLYGQFVNIIK